MAERQHALAILCPARLRYNSRLSALPPPRSLLCSWPLAHLHQLYAIVVRVCYDDVAVHCGLLRAVRGVLPGPSEAQDNIVVRWNGHPDWTIEARLQMGRTNTHPEHFDAAPPMNSVIRPAVFEGRRILAGSRSQLEQVILAAGKKVEGGAVVGEVAAAAVGERGEASSSCCVCVCVCGGGG